MAAKGKCEDCGRRRELSYAGVQRGNVCKECRASYHEETDEERADRGAPPREKNATTIKGWAYRFYKRSDPSHHYGDVLSDVRMYVQDARHRFADELDAAGRNGNLAYSAKVEEDPVELARAGRGFREIVDDQDREQKKNPKRKASKATLMDLTTATDLYHFYDADNDEIGTLYSDEPIAEGRARRLMIGKLLSEGWPFAEADDAIAAARMEHFETHIPSAGRTPILPRRGNPDHWRPIGSSGYFPSWLRALKDRSGVYAIRDAKSNEVLYVGESHTDQLYKTITRHFQRWEGYTAGTTYRRGSVEVSVQATPAGEAERKQLDWIETLQPRDNKYGQVEDVDPADFMDGVREENPSGPQHRIAARTVELGEVLDLVVELDGERLIYRDEVRGMWMLAPDDAMDRAEGGGRLFLVRGELKGGRDPDGDRPEGQRTFERWHQSHGPDQIGSIDVPDAVGVPVGRAVRIGYKSDKFGGRTASYEHDFEAPFPRVYATRKDNPKAIVIVGGGFTVSPRGIVG